MPEHRFPIAEKREVALDTLGIWFDTSAADFSYEEGQHANFELLNPPLEGEDDADRTFSFASASGRDRFLIATRVRDTAYKQRLDELLDRREIKVVGPAGRMTLHEDESVPAVFLAGGIGVTPARAMVEKAVVEGLSHRVRLLYSNRTPESTAFLEDFEGWADRAEDFEFVATVTRSEDPDWPHEYGRIDEEMLRDSFYDETLERAIFYAAGPPGFPEGMTELLGSMGVDEDRIETELFYGY